MWQVAAKLFKIVQFRFYLKAVLAHELKIIVTRVTPTLPTTKPKRSLDL